MSRFIDRRATAIVFALFLGALAGCGDEETTAEATSAEAGEEAAAAATGGGEEQPAEAVQEAVTEVEAGATTAPKVEKRNFVKLSGQTEWNDPTLQPRPSEIMPLATEANTLSVARSSVGYVAVGERGHILISQDGTEWTQIVSPSRSKLNKVWFETDNHGWAIGNDSTILETKDGGESWDLRYFEGASEPLYDIIDLKRDEYMVVGRKGSILISRDRGRNWERVENEISDFGFHFFSITRLKDNTLWVTGESGFVVRVSEDGETWEKFVSPYKGSLFGMLPLGRYGFVAHGLRGTVFVCRNHYRLQPEDMDEYDEYMLENITDEDELAELGWEKVESETTQSLFGGAITATGEVFLVGVNGAGVRSSQRVTAFQKIDMGLNYSLSDVILLGSRALVVGKNGPAWVNMN